MSAGISLRQDLFHRHPTNLGLRNVVNAKHPVTAFGKRKYIRQCPVFPGHTGCIQDEELGITKITHNGIACEEWRMNQYAHWFRSK